LSDSDLVSFIPMEAVSDRFGTVEGLAQRPVSECVGYTTFRDHDIVWAKITPCMENGKSAVVDSLQNGVGFGSTEFHVIRRRSHDVSPEYVHALLRLRRLRREATRFFTGSAGHQRVDASFLRKLVIPIPPMDVQVELVAAIRQKREAAIQLEIQAASELESAKMEIEAILLGGAA
jgi:type I restriction enzyme S subunit